MLRTISDEGAKCPKVSHEFSATAGHFTRA